MPSLKTHCAISKSRTGISFKELHEWIDAPYQKMGCDHRKERHAYNRKEARIIRNHWDKKRVGLGQKAVVEWLFHITVDNLQTAYKEAQKAYSGKRAFNFFKFGLRPESKYIFLDFDRLDIDDLTDEFKESYFLE